MDENLTSEQLQAMRKWANLYGRTWKSKLRDAWMTGDYAGFEGSNFLQQLRNAYGPSWLIHFNLSVVERMHLPSARLVRDSYA